MCGIVALFPRHQDLPAGSLRAMADLIAHRGPDGEGYALGAEGAVAFFSGPQTPAGAGAGLRFSPGEVLRADSTRWQWGLAHRRLSIIDLSPTGHQPMATGDGRCVITYNGEVYNYLELRAELESLGHRFAGHSDTEVILAAYVQWGVDCLRRFNGMFAFVLVDTQRRQMFAARDRFGVKPLYLRHSPLGLAVASEIKQFSALPDWSARADWQMLHDFLAAGITDHTDHTLFDGVTQLPPGHYLLAPLDAPASATPVAWYDLAAAAAAQTPPRTLEDAAAQFAERFADAVRLRLRADVPVGTALSGGLDSSSIVCEVRAQLAATGQGAQQSFSVCSPIKRYDERHFIDIVTAATGVQAHHVYPDTGTLLRELPQLVWHQDEPFAGTSIFAEWEVYKLARARGVKVTLDGHGADEMLCGYHPFFWIELNDLLAAGRVGRWIDELRALHTVHGYGLGAMLRSQLVAAVPARWVTPMRNLLRRERADHRLLACDDAALTRTTDPQEALRPPRNTVASESVRQLTRTSVPVQLHWADRDSMAHSVESRLPFLDYRLAEFVVACPTEVKLGTGTTKRLLRRGLAHRLPPEISGRQDKMGFVTPEQVWLCDEQGGHFSGWLRQREALALSLVSAGSLARAHRILAGQERYNRFAWRVLSLVMWAERFSVKGR